MFLFSFKIITSCKLFEKSVTKLMLHHLLYEMVKSKLVSYQGAAIIQGNTVRNICKALSFDCLRNYVHVIHVYVLDLQHFFSVYILYSSHSTFKTNYKIYST